MIDYYLWSVQSRNTNSSISSSAYTRSFRLTVLTLPLTIRMSVCPAAVCLTLCLSGYLYVDCLSICLYVCQSVVMTRSSFRFVSDMNQFLAALIFPYLSHWVSSVASSMQQQQQQQQPAPSPSASLPFTSEANAGLPWLQHQLQALRGMNSDPTY